MAGEGARDQGLIRRGPALGVDGGGGLVRAEGVGSWPVYRPRGAFLFRTIYIGNRIFGMSRGTGYEGSQAKTRPPRALPWGVRTHARTHAAIPTETHKNIENLLDTHAYMVYAIRSRTNRTPTLEEERSMHTILNTVYDNVRWIAYSTAIATVALW